MKIPLLLTLGLLLSSSTLPAASPKVTTAARAQAIEKLKNADLNRDGKLTQAELKAAFGRKRMYELLTFIDLNEDNVIDRPEISSFFESKKSNVYLIITDLDLDEQNALIPDAYKTSDPNDVVIFGTKF
ncbi:MAG: hypothetical protein SFY92_10535 [Verrucomicrobiae bacterium]|nr:hypothetical protein [Verrucomicrobiae bacterium]